MEFYKKNTTLYDVQSIPALYDQFISIELRNIFYIFLIAYWFVYLFIVSGCYNRVFVCGICLLNLDFFLIAYLFVVFV